MKRFYLERGQKTLKRFVKQGNNELLPNPEQELSKTAGSQQFSEAPPRHFAPQSVIFWQTTLLEDMSQAETPGNITREAPDPLGLWCFYQETIGFLPVGKAHQVPKDSQMPLPVSRFLGIAHVSHAPTTLGFQPPRTESKPWDLQLRFKEPRNSRSERKKWATLAVLPLSLPALAAGKLPRLSRSPKSWKSKKEVLHFSD